MRAKPTDFLSSLRHWLMEERERWILWLPVLLAAGIGLYFSLPAEPPAYHLFVTGSLIPPLIWTIRRGTAWWVPVAMLCCVACGFAVAKFHTDRQQMVMLSEELSIRELTGRVREINVIPKGIRLTLEVLSIEDMSVQDMPTRVRVKVRGENPQVMTGDTVWLRAGLLPPTGPVIPGGFDFARFFYFRDIAAVGYGLPPVNVLDHAERQGFHERLTAWRKSLSDHVRERVGLPEGAVAAALMTGDRAAIPQAVNDAMRQTNLSHILAISGMHMAMVTGIVFFSIRYGLLWIPPLAQGKHNKKIAAIVALVAGAGYLLLSGFPLSAVRAFIMVAFLLSAILLNREVTPMRSLAMAATVMLLYDPSNLLEPGFQLSFMATMALIAFYESTRFWWQGQLISRAWLRKVPAYFAAVMMTTLIAELATTPLILYHFNLLSFYGLLANLLVMPLVSFLIMPGIVLAYLLMPFGLDFLPLTVVGVGIGWMIAIADWVHRLPYASMMLSSMPWWGMVIAALGMLWLCLWMTPVRRWGLALIAVGMASMLFYRVPDVLISHDAKQIALRCADGQLYLAKGRAHSFIAEQWANQTGRERLPYLKDQPECYRCDVMGCVYRHDGKRLALPEDIAAIEEDCRMSDMVISPFYVDERRCDSPERVIDRDDLERFGSHWLFFDKNRQKTGNTAHYQGQRPWTVTKP